jgi:nitrate reductase assembly molybdenum cofactor insertion protein NarJ
MSVLASRLDRASETYRANLRLLEELAEQFPQTRAGSVRLTPIVGP